MKIAGITDIVRQPLAVEYRRLYTASAKILNDSATYNTQIEFSLEMSAFGSYEITVNFLTPPDFPIAPVTSLLREQIAAMNSARQLP